MKNIITALDTIIKSKSKVISIAVIEGENNVVYSTDNWDIREDLKTLSLMWEELRTGRFTLAGMIYIVLQCTPERLVATSLNKTGSIVGFKDDVRKIICKIDQDGLIALGLIDAAKALWELSSKEPYMAPDAPLGKIDQFEEVTPKFLFDTTKILQRLGLQKFGLSPDEAKVYLALLKKGDKGNTVGNLNKELDIKRTTIYRIMERLIKKNWVEQVSETPKGTQIYAARPITDLVDKIVREKEEEIKILKSFNLLISEYMSNGWAELSQIYKDSQSFGKEVFDIDVLGIMGLDKDFGIVVFKYDKGIVVDEIRVQDKLTLVYDKIKEQLKRLKEDNLIQDFKDEEEDTKIEYIKIQEYSGANIFLRFKKGSNTARQLGEGWIIAIKAVAIPIDNIIYIIWGSEEKFQNLMDMVLGLK